MQRGSAEEAGRSHHMSGSAHVRLLLQSLSTNSDPHKATVHTVIQSLDHGLGLPGAKTAQV